MSSNQPDVHSSKEVEVALLDPTVGSPIKTWRFSGETPISIGRGDDCMVEILDPHVSRLHACLTLCDGQWELISVGRNGVLVDGKPVSEEPLRGEVTFRLGPLGPSMRFRPMADAKQEFMQTLCFDPESMPFFVVDQSKVQEEVVDIVNDDFFQKLQQKAQDLRRQRKDG